MDERQGVDMSDFFEFMVSDWVTWVTVDRNGCDAIVHEHLPVWSEEHDTWMSPDESQEEYLSPPSNVVLSRTPMPIRVKDGTVRLKRLDHDTV